jgi:hypothetical protein
LLAVVVTVGCGGGSASSGGSNSNPTTLTGSWEATLSNVDGRGSTEYVDVNLTQSGSAVFSNFADFFILNANGDFDFSCQDNTPRDLAASLTGSTLSGTIADPYHCDRSTASFSATQANFTSLTGKYSLSGIDGNFTAQVVTLGGTYAGTLEFKDGTQENVSLTVSEPATGPGTITGTVTGPDAGPVNMTINVIGNTAIAYKGTMGTVSIESPLLAWYHAGYLYVIEANEGRYLGQLKAQAP